MTTSEQADHGADGVEPSLRLSPAFVDKGRYLAVLGGLLGATAASACCILPLVFFGLGVSGAWIGNLTSLAPYQPYFVTFAFACLGYGYWRVYQSRQVACADGTACARPLPNRLVITGLVIATILIVAAISFDTIAPLFLN
jgi:mercuric ion transport protein